MDTHPPTAPVALTVDAARSALIVIGTEAAARAADGAPAAWGLRTPAATGQRDAVRPLVAAAQHAGMPVLWVTWSTPPPAHTGAERDDPFAHSPSGFWDTPLDAILSSLHVDTVFFAGVDCDRCASSSIIDASAYGYDVVLVDRASTQCSVGGDVFDAARRAVTIDTATAMAALQAVPA